MKMMLNAKNLKFADLNSLRRFSPFSRMSEEPNLYRGNANPEHQLHVLAKETKATDFSLDPAVESEIHEKHTQLANEWRNQDSKDGFQILIRFRGHELLKT